MTTGFDTIEYLHSGPPDPRVPVACNTCVPADVLRTIAELAHDCANGVGETIPSPGGIAGCLLASMLVCAMEQVGEHSEVIRARILASILMGLAEEGDFIP